MLRAAILGGCLAVARAAQPGAVEPIAAPMRDLTWGQLNFLHTTDIHGWFGGHLLEAQYSADWGDYVSLSQHMRKRADDSGVDLLVVDTGDRIEGNGLFDASNPKGLFLYDIYAEQDVDLICSGNHELYQHYSIEREHNTTVPNFKENYIASNLDYVDPRTGERKPLAQRYRKFKTRQGLEALAFGFLFNFNGNANNTVVQKVEDTIKESWFQDAIREKPDVFIVIGHVGLRMHEFRTIFTAMRKQIWHTPIVFFGGHSHVRDALSYDSQSFAMASGRYLETIGWMSVDGIKQKKHEIDVPASTSTSTSLKFTRKYMDNNLYGMYYHTGLNKTTFPTKEGKRVTDMIARARKALDLDYRFGCAPRDLWMSRAKYPGENSIFSWLADEVFPDIIQNDKRKGKSRLALLNTGGIRFDIFKGPFTQDTTFTVSPFVNGFKYVPDVPYAIAEKVLGLLNSGGPVLSDAGVDARFLTIPEQMFGTNVQPTEDDDAERWLESQGVQKPLGNSSPELVPGYTTKDSIGDDGDDTLHEKIQFYSVPNCVESRIGFPEDGKPETVDLVFIDFLQPWIVPALKFSGGDYSNDDVEVYLEGTFTYKLSQWIREHWDGEC